MKKILLFYGSYGGGHLSAAKSIKEYIDNHHPDCEAKIVDCIECINKTVNKISISTYYKIAKKSPSTWRRIYKSSDKGFVSKVGILSNRLMSHKLNKYIHGYNPDVIISLHPFPAQMCSLLKKKGAINCRIGTVLTDFHIHNQWLVGSKYMDFFFVSNTQMKQDMCNQGIDANKIFVTGIPFSERFLNTFDRSEILKEFHLKPDKLTALFFAGGELGIGKSGTLKIFETLIANFSQIQVVAVAGKNPEVKQLFIDCVKAYNKEDNVCILEYTNKVPELMSMSDFVITKPGGLTATESLVSGLPMLIINPLAGHEEQNAEFLESAGVGIYLRKDDDIKETFKELLSSPEKFNEMKKNIYKLAKPNSAKDIVETLLTK